ncbi:MAG: DUF2202 domain-containing protein [Armatimonadota bacterium]|nr:DUF2202 domain-containing protein [Armatimonadota bacterium]
MASVSPVKMAAGLLAAVLILTGTAIPTRAAVDDQTRQALIAAINDEYHTRALYQAVIVRFGEVRPFANIVRAEEQHIAELTALFAAYGIPVPPDTAAGKVQAPASIGEACRVAAQAEIQNAALYDRLQKTVKEPDIIAVFSRLRDASIKAHLPAFQRCAR